ncbi:4'-phosphopantetheinyl transferase superfamily protein [Shewanella sp. Isolate7]|uniref:4'-phosphopantetheinyl transferase family protein n=1 Tax=Shewanella sp. Isolate7 TaxID=2908528 RepID=UPI001EFD09B7|nr:4'-phosphopantetheinyl transferase superfamily protein [Shewanella sp. Isolate7]MCG9719834.1 4'-phosphopantetheinyl transferase superfamily protein [Shewanella sp. Isolate7]
MNKVAGDAIPVHLYLCPLNLPSFSAEQQARLLDILPLDEQQKVTRYRMASAREKGLLVRCYLRQLLSQAHECLNAEAGDVIAPTEWRFDYLDKGKPVLNEPLFQRSRLVFNLSHSGDYMLLAIAQSPNTLAPNPLVTKSLASKSFKSGALGSEQQVRSLELGVDIERLRTNTNIHAILNHYFTQQERDVLLALPPERQRLRFFDLWALKESYIKAKGLGLALSLKSFYFTLSDAPHQALSFNGLAARQVWIEEAVSLFLDRENADQADAGDSQQLARPAAGWQSILGQFDDEYRFALSLSSTQPLALCCEMVSAQALLLAD